MIWRILLLTTALFVSSAAPAFAQVENRPSPCGELGQDGYLVKFKLQRHASPLMAAQTQAATLRAVGAQSRFAYSDVLAGLHHVRSVVDDRVKNALESNSSVEYVLPNCKLKLMDLGYTVAGFVRGNQGSTTDARLSMIYGEGEGISFTNPDSTTSSVAIPREQVGDSPTLHRPREFLFFKLPGGQPFQSVAAATEVALAGDSSSTALGLSLFENSAGSYVHVVNTLGAKERLFSSRWPRVAMGDLSGDGIDDLVVAANNLVGTEVKISFSERGPFILSNASFSGGSERIFAVPAQGTNPAYLVSQSTALIAPRDFVEAVPYLGNQRFGPPRMLFNLARRDDVNLGDFNGDGSPDIITIGFAGMKVYVNDGAWNFSLAIEYDFLSESDWDFGGAKLYSVKGRIADLDNDGLNDFLFVAEGVAVVFHNAGGFFDSYSTIKLNIQTTEVELDDMDRDGYLDIVFTDIPNRLVYPAYNTTAETRRANPSQPEIFSFTIDTSLQFVLPEKPYGARGIDPLGVFGTEVTLTSATNPAFVRRVKTDRNGQFTFKNIPAGGYTLTLRDENILLRTTSMRIEVTGDTAGVAAFGRTDFLPEEFPLPSVPAVSRTDDPGFDLLWGFHNGGQSGGASDVDMNIPEAWRITRGDPSVVAAVLDTGIDINHPDLRQNISFDPGSTTRAGFNAVDNNYENLAEKHGTHVAGTIAAIGENSRGVVGVAPQVKLLPVRVCDESCSVASQLAGLEYVLRRKREGLNVRVANMSLGGFSECLEPLRVAIQALHDAGVTLVAAAGNEKNDNDAKTFSPANCPVSSLLSVAALNRTGALANFSNFGSTKVSLAAPGQEIWSTTPKSWEEYPASGYESQQGTSMASPAVAGVVALIASKNPSLTPNQIKQILLESVKPLGSLTGKMVAPGIVDANKALLHPLVQGSVTEQPQQPLPPGGQQPLPKELPRPAAPKVNIKRGVMTITMLNTQGARYAVRLSYLPAGARKGTRPRVRVVTTSTPTLVVRRVAKGSWNISYSLISLEPSVRNSSESPVRTVRQR